MEGEGGGDVIRCTDEGLDIKVLTLPAPGQVILNFQPAQYQEITAKGHIFFN